MSHNINNKRIYEKIHFLWYNIYKVITNGKYGKVKIVKKQSWELIQEHSIQQFIPLYNSTDPGRGCLAEWCAFFLQGVQAPYSGKSTSLLSYLIYTLHIIRLRQCHKITGFSATELLIPNGGGDRLCGLVVRVLGYRSGGQGSIPGTNRKKK
jgi:hypothetical protein